MAKWVEYKDVYSFEIRAERHFNQASIQEYTDGEGITVTFGELKRRRGYPQIIDIQFDKDQYDIDSAQDWIRDHDVRVYPRISVLIERYLSWIFV